MAEDRPGDPNLPIEAARDALTVRKVFGDAQEVGGVTIIPVAKLMGGSGNGFGSGSGTDPSGASSDHPHAQGSGGGGGFGVVAQPAGVYVVKGGNVTWQPALDVNRAILGGQILGAIVTVAVACVLRARYRRGR